MTSPTAIRTPGLILLASLALGACANDRGVLPPTITSFSASPAQVLSGEASMLAWSTADATLCTASGPTGTTDWDGPRGTAGSQTVTPPATVGVYTYTLTCDGPGGTTNPSSVTLAVGNPVASGCLAPIVGGATAVATAATPACFSCSVSNPENVIDADPDNYAEVLMSQAAPSGSQSIVVTAQPGVVYAAGDIAGYTLSVPAATLMLAQVMPRITLRTMSGGVATGDAVTFSQNLTADVMGLLANEARYFVGIKTTKPFDGVQIENSPQVASAFAALNVFEACGNASGTGGIPAVN